MFGLRLGRIVSVYIEIYEIGGALREKENGFMEIERKYLHVRVRV